MNDYIKREDAYREIMECFKNSEMPEEWENGMHRAGMIILQDVPSAKVVEVSKILKTADEQEKQGFIQTAKVLRELVSNE
jgi:hypothetical protein